MEEDIRESAEESHGAMASTPVSDAPVVPPLPEVTQKEQDWLEMMVPGYEPPLSPVAQDTPDTSMPDPRNPISPDHPAPKPDPDILSPPRKKPKTQEQKDAEAQAAALGVVYEDDTDVYPDYDSDGPTPVTPSPKKKPPKKNKREKKSGDDLHYITGRPEFESYVENYDGSGGAQPILELFNYMFNPNETSPISDQQLRDFEQAVTATRGKLTHNEKALLIEAVRESNSNY